MGKTGNFIKAAIFSFALLTGGGLYAQVVSNLEIEYLETLQAMSLEENILSPSVADKMHDRVKGMMHAEAVKLARQGYKVETMRKGEVVVATIQTDNLFLPNDTLLIQSEADRLLTPFLKFITNKGKFKILLAVHSDNTGSKDYLIDLTTRRIESLYAWFDAMNSEGAKYVFGYPMGDAQPIKKQDTRQNRAANRRLEIYIVPEAKTLEAMKK